MANLKELEKIKRIYGERFMKLCREYFPTILEKEGVLLKILTSTFGANCKNLYEDIKNTENEEEFKKFIFSKVDVENDMKIIKNKTPYELLDEAGYTLFECNSEEEIQVFKKYYAENEELCTFNGGRLNKCVVFFAVKKDVENIRRENFEKPRREDEYGTSVLGIQFDKQGRCTVSIKNRYNHIVNNPDATYGNDLDKIIPGLTNSFKELLLVHNLDFNTSNIEKFSIPGYVVANDGKYYKYNMEIDGKYYCPGNIVIDFGNVIKIEGPEKQLLIENFVLDTENKIIKLYDQEAMYDSFLDGLQGIEKIDIQNDNENKDGSKIIILKIREQEISVIIKIDKESNITYYENENLIKVGDFFLGNNKKIKALNLRNLKIVGNNFLPSNEELKELDLQNLEIVGDRFLWHNQILNSLNVQNLREVGDNFLVHNLMLSKFYAPNLIKVGNNCLYYNVILSSFEAQNLRKIGIRGLTSNEGLKELDLPSLEIVEGEFLRKNKILNSFKALNLRIIDSYFLYSNKMLKILELPNLENYGIGILANNTNIRLKRSGKLGKPEIICEKEDMER